MHVDAAVENEKACALSGDGPTAPVRLAVAAEAAGYGAVRIKMLERCAHYREKRRAAALEFSAAIERRELATDPA